MKAVLRAVVSLLIMKGSMVAAESVDYRQQLRAELIAWSEGEQIMRAATLDTPSYLALRFLAKMQDLGRYKHRTLPAASSEPDPCRDAIIGLKYMLIDISQDHWPRPADKAEYRRNKAACLSGR